MLYAETKIAAVMFGVKCRSLANAAARNSSKYPFVEILNTKTRGYSGKRLLFEISAGELKVALKSKKIAKDERVYSFCDGELKELKMSEVFPELGLSEAKKGEICSDFNGSGVIDAANISRTTIFKDADNVARAESLDGKKLKSCDSAIKNKIKMTKNLTKNADCVDIASKTNDLTYFQLNEKQKADIDEKIKLIKTQEKSKLSVSEFCKLNNLSKTTFYRWKKDYKEAGAVGLADKSGMHRKGATKLEPWMREFILDKFRAYSAGGFNYTECTDSLNAEIIKRSNTLKFGENIINDYSYCDAGTIRRFIDNYYKKNRLEYLMVTKGEDKAKSYMQPAMGSEREIYTFKNQCWQIDSSPLDMIVRDDETKEPLRPHIISIVDVYSGRGVISLEKTSSSMGIIKLLWEAISTLGKPMAIKGDNGKDYKSKQFQGLLKGLKIEYIAAKAYHGEQKGMVERRFKTLQHSGIKMLPGYIGNDLKIREQIEQRTPKKDRHAKDEFGYSKMTNLEHLLTFSEAKKALEALNLRWELQKGKRVNNRLSAVQKWNNDDTPLIKVEKPEFLLYAGAGGERKVTKKGINYKGFEFVSPLLPDVGTSVEVRENLESVNELYVFDEKGNFLCVAKERSISDMSVEEYSIIKKAFDKDVRAIRKVIKNSEISDFSKLNVEYDLEKIKELHKDSLKAEKWEKKTSVKEIENVIKASKEALNLREKNGDYLNFILPEEKEKIKKKKKIKGWEEIIEDAS